MRSDGLFIKKSIFCLFDGQLPFVNTTEVHLGVDDEERAYLNKLVAANFDNIASKKAHIGPEDFLATILPTGEDDFEPFVNYISDEIHNLMQEGADIGVGSGIFLLFEADEQNFVAFFKLDFQTKFLNVVGEAGTISWKKSTMVLPAASQKGFAFFYINLNTNQMQISDSKFYVQDRKCNYLEEYILKLEVHSSEKELVKTIDEVMVETIEEHYPEEVPQKVLEYKKVLAETVEESGKIDLQVIEEKVFSDNEVAANSYKEKKEERKLPEEAVYVSPKLEKKLTKKQRIVTDNGIELLVPIELLEDKSMFEYRQGDDGKITIVLREIGSIMNK